MTLTRGQERFQAILFQYAGSLPDRIRAAYRPESNEWQGTTSLQLTIEHWLPA
jgi:single-stranded-DNA-specific exonuclease